MSNELAFSRIVESDLRLRDELQQTTNVLERQFELLESLCENLIGEKIEWKEKNKSLLHQLSLEKQSKCGIHKACQTVEAPDLQYGKKYANNEPILDNNTTNINHLSNQSDNSSIIKSNETLLELMILDLDIRSKLLKNK